MHLIQFLLPVYDNDGQRILKARFDAVRNELAQRFGGVTAYVRAPAVGAWADEAGELQRDDVILFEVMAPALDRSWWTQFRHTLEQRFGQEAVLCRATRVDVL